MFLGYLDAGTGSVILQAVVGGVAAAGVMFRFYGRRFLVFLRLRKPTEASTPPSEEQD